MGWQTNIIITNVVDKPVTKFIVTQSAAIATFLSWIGVITPVLGFIAGAFGVVYGYFSVRLAIKKWKDANRKRIHPKKD